MVDEWSSVIMLCCVCGFDEFVVIWMFEKIGGIIINIVFSVIVQIYFNGDLIYFSVILQNGGLYICKVCNIVGCVSVKVYLDVLCKLI